MFSFRKIHRGYQISETIERTCFIKRSISHFNQYQSFKGLKNSHADLNEIANNILK